jgi:hypothetical protein
MARIAEPEVEAAFTSIITSMGPALENLAQHVPTA